MENDAYNQLLISWLGLECYQGKYDINKTPVASYIADRVLAMPIYADLQIEEIDSVCDIVLGLER